MKYVLVFGNPYIKEDNLAFKISKEMKIKGIVFKHCSSPEEIIDYLDKEFIILDVVKNIKEVAILEDINKLKINKLVSLHDFDLAFFLNIMAHVKRRRIRIVGIPQKNVNIDKVVETIKKAFIPT